jgi:malonyl-CoA O-methyltransferase
MTALPAREAYRLWAPTYQAETAVSWLEKETVAELGIATTGCTLLDVGCGTARRLRDSGASLAIGVDVAPEMLSRATSPHSLACADMRALPFAAESFDVVWCRLAIGHVSDALAAYSELSRVCCIGGTVLVTDLCVEAVDAGHRRTFRDATGVVRETEHFVHTEDVHVRGANSAGLELVTKRTGVVGPSIKHFYDDAGRSSAYDAQCGLPLILALSLRRRS